jgi:hypothetical protein
VTKTDLVAHNVNGAPPKVFTDTDARQAEVRDGGDVRWVGWRHKFDVAVNMDLLHELYENGYSFDVYVVAVWTLSSGVQT